MAKNVYEFTFDDCYGILYGIFVATPEEVAKLIGQEAYFGEVLGKHSEVYGTISANHISLLTDNPEVVKWLEEKECGGLGYNPFDHVEKQDEDECETHCTNKDCDCGECDE